VNEPTSVEGIQALLAEQAYLADRGVATAVHLAIALRRPLLVEGEAGVGKTELAKALAEGLGRELIRLQCYEGIDASQALYEWDYTRQLLYIRALGPDTASGAGQAGDARDAAIDDVFSARFLVERPLLRALRAEDRAVLLVDEVDRADDEFEAFLLEFLSDFQVTVPEVGTIRAQTPPIVVLTSNRTRELHDALKRRCLYHWIDYPDLAREVEIVRARAPEVPPRLATRVAAAVERIRGLDLGKPPGIAETIDWARALALLDSDAVTTAAAGDTLGLVVKDHEDLERVRGALEAVLSVD
jgi:MoxR-like ATPase